MMNFAVIMSVLGLVCLLVIILVALDIGGKIRLAQKPLVYLIILLLPVALPLGIGLILLSLACIPLLLAAKDPGLSIIADLTLAFTLLLLLFFLIFIVCRANRPRRPARDAAPEVQHRYFVRGIHELCGYGTFASVINTIILAFVLIILAAATIFALTALVGFVQDSGGLLQAIINLIAGVLLGFFVALAFFPITLMTGMAAVAVGFFVAGAVLSAIILLILQYIFSFNALRRYLRIVSPQRKWPLYVSLFVPIWSIVTLRRICRETGKR